jgi:hypothetical protein
MFLGIITLLVALTISGIAAYYSIVGLTAIFAASFWPIVIMGSALEAGKICATVWLHYHWKEATVTIKWYLIGAVGVLMFITSMGIFGFLSKSHADQTLVSGDVQSQIQLFDEKIKTQRDNIETARKTLVQMDSSVDQLMSRTTDEKGATKASDLRRSQARERARLQKDIDIAQEHITQIQEERAPIAAQVRKVEAEVGPIRYIAALIYGESADHSLLESAVRWVIIIIVTVFDPLAIVLILAAIYSFEWAAEAKAKRVVHAKKEQDIALQHHVGDLEREVELLRKQAQEAIVPVLPPIESEEQDLDLLEEELKNMVVESNIAADKQKDLERKLSQAEIDLAQAHQAEHESLEINKELLFNLDEAQSAYSKAQQDQAALANEIIALQGEINVLKSIPPVERIVEVEKFVDRIVEVEKIVEKIVEVPVYVDPVHIDPEEQEQLHIAMTDAEPIAENIADDVAEDGDLERPGDYIIEELPVSNEPNFGVSFPIDPAYGELFLRTDFYPSKLYKWNGDKWIEVDKENTTSYTYNEQYIQMLIEKIGTGEYDIDELSELEREEIQTFLSKIRG